MTRSPISRKVNRPHWYHRHEEECVLCGVGEVVLERRYGRKPKDHKERYSYSQFAHSDHFL